MGPPKRSRRPDDAAEDIELGYVSGVFGVKGEVRVFLHHRGAFAHGEARSVLLLHPDDGRFEAVMTVRPGAGKRILARIDGISDRDEAARWQGARIAVSAADLPPLEEGEYYLWQLEGADVEVDGRTVGRVVEVHQTGPVDILEVHVGREVFYVPSLRDVVLELDLERGRVVLAADALAESE